VGDPVGPRAQRAAAVESIQALPQRQLDVLKQIAPPFGIRFVTADQPPQRRSEGGGRFRIQIVLLRQRLAL
jgi:hypothetical protein